MINRQTSFCRIENKYLVPESLVPFLIAALESHMDYDPYAIHDGHYQVNTIYFDNKNNDVVDRSVAHPTYKEKLRLRSYGGKNPIYFIEFKNKYLCDVFKVRIILSEKEYENYVFHQIVPSKNGNFQHDRFIDTLADFIHRHGEIVPKSVIQYDRAAFVNKPFENYLRVTIDSSLTFRRENFHLNELGGAPLLGEGFNILEIKIERALPLWLAQSLNQLGIYRDRFSKYGASYLDAQNEPLEIRLNPLTPVKEKKTVVVA
jgi:hypothetical protein